MLPRIAASEEVTDALFVHDLEELRSVAVLLVEIKPFGRPAVSEWGHRTAEAGRPR